jgi:DNA-binding NarL/FixJ family response regulator
VAGRQWRRSCDLNANRRVAEKGAVTVVVGRFPPVVGRGLVAVLREDRRIHIVDSDLEPLKLERTVAQRSPRVVILDEADERSTRARLRTSSPETEILVFAHDPTPTYGTLLLADGATCVAWSVPAEDIRASVHLAAEGARIFASADGERVERRYPSEARLLTHRETEVLEHLSRGETNAEIALALGIGIETVRTYVASVLRKLNVQSRQKLVGMPIPASPEPVWK